MLLTICPSYSSIMALILFLSQCRSVHFVSLSGPGPKEPSESLHTQRVSMLERVRTDMHHKVMRFLQEQATISSINYETVSSSSPPTKEYTTQFTSPSIVWKIWAGWVKPDVFYKPKDFWSSSMDNILVALASSPVTQFDLGHRGTQLKATLYLEGGQRTVFKPKRCDKYAAVIILFFYSVISSHAYYYKIPEEHYCR